ncbi:MAG: immune inhibitor [Nocardioidaceae bacterium]|nr:immune inhibitor [Nocardioidaceae bacterium]
MSRSPQRRLRAALVSIALAAGVGLVALPAVGSAEATPAAAPDASGIASGFLFYVTPDPQPTCVAPVSLNNSADPALDRAACGFVNFTPSGATGTMTADLYSGDAPTPFKTNLPTTASTSSAGTRNVELSPDGTWPAGPVKMVVKDSTGPIGDYHFFVNPLRTSPSATGVASPGDAFNVTGTISEVSGRATFTGAGVPAGFKVRLTRPDGSVLFTSPVQTAAGDGTFTYAVPAGTTSAVTADASSGFKTTLGVRIIDAAYDDTTSLPATGAWASPVAGSTGKVIAVPATDLLIQNSFVSSAGWVKPGDTYPSRIIVTNPTTTARTPSIQVTAPAGSTILTAGATTVNGPSYTWTPGSIPAGETRTLVLSSQAATTSALPTVVWRDLSSTAVMTGGGLASPVTVLSHGPKVIPPNETYDTARYGDRPFPIVPLQFNDRSYQPTHSGDSLESVINDPGNPGSTFNLYQEMSLGQLYPNGTVPSAGITSADFTGFSPAKPFTKLTDGTPTTCHGTTYADLPAPVRDAVYTQRIANGVYNLPGSTDYYGDDANGSALIGAETGVGALQNIDAGCGPTSKVVADAVALADPEIDYSDYDTDKDGVVDFFMGVFAGCGGNGSSQLSVAGCAYPDAPYDNIWPHSSSLEGTYSDPVTKLPGVVTNDQLKDLEGRPLCWQDAAFTVKGPDCTGGKKKVFVRVGPYNLNPETAIDFASVISHEYGHSLGLPDFYSTGSRATYGSWTLMAEDHSQNIDAFGRQELGWVVPRVLPKTGTKTVTGWQNSKKDIDTITWQQPDGTPYTLQEGVDGRVQNSEMYVAKLPGRQLLDPSVFTPSATNEGASASHLWWSGSGNDFGCPPTSGHNFDLSVPGLSALPAGSTVKLTFKSRWDTEWDFDYGYVLTTIDGGNSYTSHPSENGYTSSNTDPTAGNPNQASCQTTYDNGITGSSGSYQANSQAVDRKAGNYPEPVFLSDSYDISDLAGKPSGAIRFAYATDPGLARPGWFIDDVKVTATTPGGDQVLLDTDFETSGGPEDPHVYNGGCRDTLTTAQKCTQGWKYLQAGALSAQDHAYYLEMRDRSGFDYDAHGQADRGEPTFGAGLYLSYTDEAHGYGNVGTDDPPAQSPLDSVPQPGNDTPTLDDAAFTDDTGRTSFSDSGAGHTDNYTDPSSPSGNWEFKYGCLGFHVDTMGGKDAAAVGNLTGDVTFTMGSGQTSGCGDFDYGYLTGPPGAGNTAPTAQASATPNVASVGQQVQFSAEGSTDAETPGALTYGWDFGDGTTSAAKNPTHAYDQAKPYQVKLTVTDPQGLSGTATVGVTVTGSGGGNTAPAAEATATPTDPATGQPVVFSAAGSTDAETPGALTYAWRFGDGTTASGVTATHAYASAGHYTARVTVTDPGGLTGAATVSVTVRSAVTPPGSGNASVRPVAVIKVKPKRPGTDRKVRFVGKRSTGTGALTYTWNFHNGGKRLDATGKKVKTFVRRAGVHMVTLTVTDSTGATAKQTVRYRVRHHYSNRAALSRAVGQQLSRQLAGLF